MELRHPKHKLINQRVQVFYLLSRTVERDLKVGPFRYKDESILVLDLLHEKTELVQALEKV